MGNLYSMTRNVDAIRRLFKVDSLQDSAGNLPPLPGILSRLSGADRAQ